MVPGMFLGVKGGWRVGLKTSTPSVSLDVSQPYGPSRLVTRIALPFALFLKSSIAE
jgi:hypothetical protein